jgi:hypothetical protein
MYVSIRVYFCLSVCRPMRSAAAARWASATESAVRSFLSFPHIFCFAVSLFCPFSPLFVSVSFCILRDRTTPSPSPFPQPLFYCNYYYHHNFLFSSLLSTFPTTDDIEQAPACATVAALHRTARGCGRAGRATAATSSPTRGRRRTPTPSSASGRQRRTRHTAPMLCYVMLCSVLLCSAS